MRATRTPKQERGFSLIELLIVVLIIGTIAAIALPNYVVSRQSAHNASAIASLRLIISAEAMHRASHDQYGDLAALGASGSLSDPLLINGQRSHYNFTIAGITADSYQVQANPVVAPWRFYYADVSGVIRSKMGAPAGPNDTPID